MKLSKLYPNILNDFQVKNVTSKLNEIKKNTIYINTQNHQTINIPDSIKKTVLIVTKVQIPDTSIFSINVINIYDELVRIYSLYYGLTSGTKVIGIINDDFLNYQKIVNDLYTNTIKEQAAIINTLDDIDTVYKTIGKYIKKKIKNIFVYFHSSEVADIVHQIYFDYIILPKSSHTTSLKSLMNTHSLLKQSGILIYNYDDFNDLFMPNKHISFGIDNRSLYQIRNIHHHNKIITGTIFKKDEELTEFLLCLSNNDYMYFIIALFVFFSNEFQSVELVHIFFSKYIL